MGWISDVVGAAVGIGGQLLANDSRDQAAKDQEKASQESANLLKKGYDAQLVQLLTASKAMQTYAGRDLEAVASIISDAAKQYGLSMNDAFAMYQQAEAKNTQAMTPYTEAGVNALDQLRGVAGADPNQLTPSERLLASDYRRDAAARLASSGLRGAGRAGVAAVNEGDARLRAQLYDQNQARSDKALEALRSMGYGATKDVMDINNVVAGQGLQTGQAVAGNNQTSQQKIADANSAYQKQMSDIAASIGAAKGGTEAAKGAADAAAKSSASSFAGQVGAANAAGWGQTAGWLANLIAKSTSANATPNYQVYNV